MKGIKLSYKEVANLCTRFTLSTHALQRMKERTNYTINKLRSLILNTSLAYVNTDNCINIKINDNDYVVVSPDFQVITYKERSRNGISLYQKYLLALKGVRR